MALSFDLNQVDDVKKPNSGGQVKPGRCHAVFVEFDEYGEPKSGSHFGVWEIVAHDDPKQVGKKYKDLLGDPANGKSEKGVSYAMGRLLHYAYVLGVTTPDEMEAAKKSGQQPNLDLNNGAGQQVFLEIVEEKYDGKINSRIADAGFAIMSINDPKCKDFPANQAMLARAKKSATKQPAGDAGSLPTQSKQEANDPFAAVT